MSLTLNKTAIKAQNNVDRASDLAFEVKKSAKPVTCLTRFGTFPKAFQMNMFLQAVNFMCCCLQVQFSNEQKQVDFYYVKDLHLN